MNKSSRTPKSASTFNSPPSVLRTLSGKVVGDLQHCDNVRVVANRPCTWGEMTVNQRRGHFSEGVKCRLQVSVASHCFTITETTQTFTKMLTLG